MSSELRELVQRLGHPRVLVVGDLMLDHYTFGVAERVSQESPVPVLRIDGQESRLGGAGAVAAMLACLEAEVTLAGVVGADAAASTVRGLLHRWGLRDELVLEDSQRPTTSKERFIGRAPSRHLQPMLRVDREVRDPIPPDLEKRLLGGLEQPLRDCDLVLVSDYGKGVCTPALMGEIIGRARAAGRRVVIDPVPGADYQHYRNATCITPNRTEARLAASLPVDTVEDALVAGERLRSQLDLEAVVVTLDKDGMVLVHADGRRLPFPTRPRQVSDVTGAGDMVLSVLGLCLAAGEDFAPAIALSNVAAGLEVERFGAATVTRTDVFDDLQTAEVPGGKVWTLEPLRAELERQRRQGKRIVFTNGCFDVLHAGHVHCLRHARSLGDRLVVGLNSDAGVARLKGPGRPLNGAASRAEVLSALTCVDYVIVFGEETPIPLLQALRPDVLVKGGDYRLDQVVGREIVDAYGGSVVVAPFLPGHSTTRLVARFPPEAADADRVAASDQRICSPLEG